MSTMSNAEGEYSISIDNPGWEDPKDFLEQDPGNWGESKRYPIIEVGAVSPED